MVLLCIVSLDEFGQETFDLEITGKIQTRVQIQK